MTSISAIALSGMNAAVRRLDVSASNVANQMSTGALPANGSAPAGAPSAYQPLRVDQVAVSGGGTQANIAAVTPSSVPAYDPNAAFADGSGMVAAPNVDLSNEAIQQITAKFSFAANLRVMQAGDSLTRTLLDMKV
jgi:flagellar basal-body rod protein FlgC